MLLSILYTATSVIFFFFIEVSGVRTGKTFPWSSFYYYMLLLFFYTCSEDFFLFYRGFGRSTVPLFSCSSLYLYCMLLFWFCQLFYEFFSRIFININVDPQMLKTDIKCSIFDPSLSFVNLLYFLLLILLYHILIKNIQLFNIFLVDLKLLLEIKKVRGFSSYLPS